MPVRFIDHHSSWQQQRKMVEEKKKYGNARFLVSFRGGGGGGEGKGNWEPPNDLILKRRTPTRSETRLIKEVRSK